MNGGKKKKGVRVNHLEDWTLTSILIVFIILLPSKTEVARVFFCFLFSLKQQQQQQTIDGKNTKKKSNKHLKI